MSETTARERVIMSLRHQEPDRLPMDFGGRHTTVHAFTHRELKRYLGLEGGEERIRDYHTYTVEPDDRLTKRFGRDTTPVATRGGKDYRFHIDPSTNTYLDEWGTRYYMPPDGYYFDILEPALARVETVEDLAGYKPPNPRDPARLVGVREAIDAAHADGKAVMMCSGRAGIWTSLWYLRGFEQSYIDLVSNLKLAEGLAEIVTDWHIAYWDMVLAELGDLIDIVHVEGDAGGMDGPLFSPALFRKVFKPLLSRWISSIKSKTRAPVFIHSCGSIYWVIPDFIECGIDILNPVQLNAADMETARLKKEFGKDVSFWGGGCDTVILQRGSPREVADEVKRRIDDLAPGGGFVFGSVHNIQPGVPPENVEAMFETARRYGGY